MTRRIALLLEYDGTAFAGSQLQGNARTVQGVLEAAVEKTTGETARVAFAGRTDAGVHAEGQVASFVTGSALDCDTLQRALNAWLPDDVAVRGVADVDHAFDPRRSAMRRRYRYEIDNRFVRPALGRRRAWHVAQRLDETAMSHAAAGVVGHHDFAAFASRLEDEGASTVRDLQRFDVTRNGDALTCELEANAFLPHQVRRMVGALVGVGKGKLSIEGYTALLAGAPGSAGPAAPPHGLYLERVFYEADPFAAVERPPSADQIADPAAQLRLLSELARIQGLYLMGGFAEDAVLDGTVTRDRSDLDFLVKAGSWEAIRRELQLAGFLRFERLLTGPAGEALAYKSTAGVCEIEVWLAEETAEGYAIGLPSHAPAGGHGFFRLRLPSDTFAFPRTPLGRMPVQTISPLALSLFRAASALTRGDAAKQATDVLVRDRLRRECLSDRPPDELAPAIAPLAST